MKTKNKFFSRLSTIFAITLFIGNTAFAQVDDSTATISKPKKDTRPVKDPFESGYILNNQTIIVPTANTLEMAIQHRFGKLNSKDFDLGGLYAPSNIRIGLSYSITDDILIGAGTTKNNKLQDLNWKYVILRQTRSGNIPINITYFGDATIDVRKEVFPKFTNRLSYFHQLIFARKFNKSVSLQIAPSYSHFNMVDSLLKWDDFAISASGRVKVTNALAVIFEYNYLLTKQPEAIISVKPGVSLGIEAVTSGHAFQIFIGSLDGLNNQYDILNKNDFLKKEVLIGFNITRLWSF